MNYNDPAGLARCWSSFVSDRETAVTCETAYGKRYKHSLHGVFGQDFVPNAVSMAETGWARSYEIRDFTFDMRARMRAAVASLSANCQKELGSRWNVNVGPSSLYAKVDSIEFFDACQHYVYSKPAKDFGLEISGTLFGFLNANPDIMALVDTQDRKLNNRVIISPTFFKAHPVWFQDANLVHELLHVYAGLDDYKLAAALDLGTFSTVGDASNAITIFLIDDCTRGSK